MKIGRKKIVEVEAKTIKVHAKPSDAGDYTLVDAEGVTICDHDGYVPDFFPGDHSGDYLILDIDLETGKVLNWKPPTQKQLEAFVAECEGEDA